MKTKLMSLLATVLVLLSCEESLQVEGPKIPEANKTLSVTLSNIPSGFTGGTVYVVTLNHNGEVYAIQEAKATDGVVVQIAPAAGFYSFDIAAIIPTASNWSSKNPFVQGHYSRATAIQGKDGNFVTKTWTSAPTLEDAPAAGLTPTITAELLVNGSLTPTDTDFTKGEIVTLNALVSDNIRANIASVEFLVDATSLETYTTKPYQFQFNTANIATGNHWLYVKALNDLGHASADSIRIYVSDVAGNVAPSIALTGVMNGAEFDRQTVLNIGASVSDPDDGIEKVELKIDNNVVDTDLTAPYSFTWDTYNSEAGPVVVEVVAYDKAGQSRSDVVNVTLVEPENYIPRVTLTSPTSGSNFAVGHASIELTATVTDTESDPIDRVEFYYRKSTSGFDAYLGQATTSPYTFTFDTSALTAGTYYIFARVYDNIGRSTYTQATITIQ